MGSLLALLVSIPFLIFISLSVFGGGQIFMPIFSWFWNLLNSLFGVNITAEEISQVFAISNATPGIISPKFGLLTGYLVANGQWWGYLAIFLTFFVFVIPAFLMMFLAKKYMNKFSANKYLSKLINLMNPVVTGIVGALAIQLIISVAFPMLTFNASAKEYFVLSSEGAKALFFTNWRKIVLFVYVPVGIILSTYLYFKKCPIVVIIIANLIVSLILFQPWLQ